MCQTIAFGQVKSSFMARCVFNCKGVFSFFTYQKRIGNSLYMFFISQVFFIQLRCFEILFLLKILFGLNVDTIWKEPLRLNNCTGKNKCNQQHQIVQPPEYWL